MDFNEMAKANLTKLAAEPKGGGWVTATNQEFAALASQGLVQTDGQADAEGDVYFSITETGRNWLAAHTPPTIYKTPAFDASDADWNQPRRRGAGLKKTAGPSLRELWRLDAMPVGASVHIPATAEVPEPWKSYGSTIAAENKRWATMKRDDRGELMSVARKARGKEETRYYPVYEYSKYFVIFRAHDNDPCGPGARIKRVDPVTKR